MWWCNSCWWSAGCHGQCVTVPSSPYSWLWPPQYVPSLQLFALICGLAVWGGEQNATLAVFMYKPVFLIYNKVWIFVTPYTLAFFWALLFGGVVLMGMCHNCEICLMRWAGLRCEKRKSTYVVDCRWPQWSWFLPMSTAVLPWLQWILCCWFSRPWKNTMMLVLMLLELQCPGKPWGSGGLFLHNIRVKSFLLSAKHMEKDGAPENWDNSPN